MDVKAAFLQAPLTEEVYMEQPEGFVSAEQPNLVCRLLKSLYGLKQAPYEWNKELDSHLKRNGFQPTPVDPCVYFRRQNGLVAFIVVYVDDFTIIAHCSEITKVKTMLSDQFTMKDLGEAKSILGYEILRDRERGTLDLRQGGRIKEYLTAYQMEDCKPIHTPMQV